MRWHQRLFRRARTERQLDAELGFHLEQQIVEVDERPEFRLEDAGDDLDQRRFSGAVLADERVDVAAPDVKTHIGKGVRRSEGLGEPNDAKGWRAKLRRHAPGRSSIARGSARWMDGAFRIADGSAISPPARVRLASQSYSERGEGQE